MTAHLVCRMSGWLTRLAPGRPIRPVARRLTQIYWDTGGVGKIFGDGSQVGVESVTPFGETLDAFIASQQQSTPNGCSQKGICGLSTLPRIGYVPYNPTLKAPGDRRRFVAYAQARNLPFELARFDERYDVVILSEVADISIWSELSARKGRLRSDRFVLIGSAH